MAEIKPTWTGQPDRMHGNRMDRPGSGELRQLTTHDTVGFEIDGSRLIYEVMHDHLKNMNGDNDRIFNLLGVNKERFSEKAYGYPPNDTNGRIWPTSKDNDMGALSRLVNELYEAIDEHNDQPQIKEVAKPMPIPRPAVKKFPKYVEYDEGDFVEFYINGKIITYTVINSGYLYLDNEGSAPNGEIFKELGLSEGQSRDWARKCYGYEDQSGDWPAAKENDFQALNIFINDINRILKRIDHSLDDEDVWEIINKREIVVNQTTSRNISNNQLNQLTNGNIIKTERPTPEVRIGKKITGHSISGKPIRTSTEVGHLSYRKVSG